MHPSLPDALARLRAGGVVAFPTETVYGLGADARNPSAVARVFALKQRPARNPLIVHVHDADAAKPLAARWPPEADALARAFWPGPLTIVLPRSAVIPDIVTAGADTVALRCPDHPLALELLRAFNGPLVGPSANPSGRVSPTTAQHVRDAFTPHDVLVLDGGPCRVGIESTVVSLAHAPPRVLRLGAVSPDDLSRALGGMPVLTAHDFAHTDPHAPLPAPGMLASHYAPAAPARLCDPGTWRTHADHAPRPCAVLALDPQAPAPIGVALFPMPADPNAYAARLYAALRDADSLRPALILIETPPDPGPLWDALRDRLRRAAAPRA